MAEIAIHVLSYPKEGKSTVATLIAKILAEHGFDVTHNTDLDGPINLDRFDSRVKEVAEKAKISITEHQAVRGPVRQG